MPRSAPASAGWSAPWSGPASPRTHAHYYQGEFEAGRTIVTVQADGRADEAMAILRRYDAYDIDSRPDYSGTAASRGRTSPWTSPSGART